MEISLSWLAGFIDGEGYIGILRQRKAENSKHSASLLYHPYLIITNSNYNIIRDIKEIIGNGYIHELSSSNYKRKKAFQYKLSKMDDLMNLLNTIQPFLHIKQPQCNLVIEFINKRKQTKRISGRGNRGATSFSNKEEKIYQNLRKLNKRGL